MILTVEEMTLLRSFDTSTRRSAILSMMHEMGMMQDKELVEQCRATVKKLENTSDDDFAAVDFTVYDDDDSSENLKIEESGDPADGKKEVRHE